MTSGSCPQCGATPYEVCDAHPEATSCFRRSGIKPCRSPYCECEHGKCTHPGFYDARGTAPDTNPMKALLDEAAAAVVARGKRYGEPEDNFKRIARRWSVHMLNRYGIDISLDEVDVASMMIDVKQARLENDPTHRDSWVDIAGYAAGGGSFDQAPADAAWDEAKKKREAIDTL